MKRLGIIRRIDELGRIVVPKELRKSLHLKVGDYLEFYTDKEAIILKKYSELKGLEEFTNLITETVYQTMKKNILITDRDKIIAYEGNDKKKFLDKKIGKDIIECIEKRVNMLEKYPKNFEFIDGFAKECSYAVNTIVVQGIEVGTIIVFDDKNSLDETDYKVLQIISSFLEKNLEQE